MNLRLPLTISVVLAAAMAALSVYAWTVLPPDVRLATHWGMDGKVNGTMGKAWGLALLPAIAFAVAALLALIPVIEPRRQNLKASRKAFVAIWLSIAATLALCHALIVFAALGFVVDIPSTLILVVPAAIAIAGNYLGKVRPNFFIGVRTPWTLSSDLSWEKSHRLLGRLFVLSALATWVARFALGVQDAFLVFAATMTASALVAIASSYIYWKHDPERAA